MIKSYEIADKPEAVAFLVSSFKLLGQSLGPFSTGVLNDGKGGEAWGVLTSDNQIFCITGPREQEDSQEKAQLLAQILSSLEKLSEKPA